MLREKSDMFSSSINLYYSSEMKLESLVDTQMFFPELFQVNFMTLIGVPSTTTDKKDDIERKLQVYFISMCSV